MMKAATTNKKITSGLPPARRREKSAERPMDEKNISMNAVCNWPWNLKVSPNNALSANTTMPASRPPATARGC